MGVLSPVISAFQKLPTSALACTALLASLATPKSLDIVSINLAAAIWDADALYPVNTASVFVNVLDGVASEHDSSVVLLETFRKLRMREVDKIHEGCK